MASLFTIEKRSPGGAWEQHTHTPLADRKKIADGLGACVLANPDKEWRVAEYVRADDVRWFLQFENTPPTDGRPASWRNWERDGYPTREAALADLPAAQRDFPTVPWRLFAEISAFAVHETFPPKAQ